MPGFWSQLLVPELWIISTAGLVPGALLVGMVHLRNWRIDRRRQRLPVQEKLLRSPGESLRKKLVELEDQIGERLMFAMVLPPLCASFGVIQHLKAPMLAGSGWIAPFIGVGCFAVLCRQLLRLLDERRRYRLGLSGELAAAEELNRLMLCGCHVFHDVPNLPVVATWLLLCVERQGCRWR